LQQRPSTTCRTMSAVAEAPSAAASAARKVDEIRYAYILPLRNKGD
jgi:hypothetical protein